MKNTIKFVLGLSILLLAGCRIYAPVSQQSGKEDVAYLLFVSSSGQLHKQKVFYTIDDFGYEAIVVKQKSSSRRGTQYTAPTGNHQLTVTKDGQTLYSKRIFLSQQEVKQIILP